MAQKNLTFPFAVRSVHSDHNNLIGHEKIAYLGIMTGLAKNDQYLLMYNFKNEKRTRYINSSPRSVYVKTDVRSEQTTFVLDFDNLVPSTIKQIEEDFLVFNEFVNNKAILIDSASGNKHVIFVVNGAIPEGFYKRIQKYIVQKFFDKVSPFVDSGSSYSLTRSFFHSQHLHGWINLGFINVTPSAQKNGGFWVQDRTIKMPELMNLLDHIQVIESRGVHELVYDTTLMIAFLQFLCGAPGDNDEEKTRTAERIFRTLATIRSGEEETVKKYTKEICNRAQTAKYQAAFQYLQSAARQTILRTEAISKICREVAEWDESSRSVGNENANGSDLPQTASSNIRGTDSESSGHGSSSVIGNDGAERIRHRNDSSVEHLLGIVQDLRHRLESRGLTDKKLGDVFLSNSLRSDCDGNLTTEKSDIQLYSSWLREVMDRDPRICRIADSTQECHSVWLRHARNRFRSKDESLRSVQEFTSNAARCLRLCPEAQNVKVKLDVLPPRINVSIQEAEAFLALISCNIDSLSLVLSKQNRYTLFKLFRSEQEFLVTGTRAFLTRIKELFPLMRENKSIAMGLEDFESFFETHGQRAFILRKIFMAFCGKQEKDYIAHVRRREFTLNLAVFDEILEKNYTVPSTPADLIVLLGSGKTWSSICKYLPIMCSTLGVSSTKELWYTSLDLGSANCAEQRKKDVDSFIQKLQSKR